MPPPQPVDPTQDPDFMSASLPDQSAYLAHIDPDYAAASPQDKLAYLGHITGKNLTLPSVPNSGSIGPPQGAGQRTAQEASRLASSAVNSKFPYIHPFDAMGTAADEASQEIQHYAPRALTEFLLGGQAAGKPMGTQTGFANNPILNLVMAPMAGEAVGKTIEPIAEQATASLPKASNAITTAKNAIGNFVRDPDTGKLTAGTSLLAHAAGAATGYEAGKQMTGSPYGGYAGAAIGGVAGPTIAESILPESTNAAYNKLGDMLVQRGKEQADLDKQAEQEIRRARSEAITAGRNAPGPWNPSAAKKAYEASQELPATRIAYPSDPALARVGNEGRAATWTNDRVLELAKQGNREAITQAVRRGLSLPENARYVMGDPDFRASVYNPREVTTFTPEGIPIKQAGKKPTILPWERNR